MALSIDLEFDLGDSPGLEAPHLARLLLDIQHLMTVSVVLARPAVSVFDILAVTRITTYKAMAEASELELGDTTAVIDRIVQESPLQIGVQLKAIAGGLKDQTGKVLRFVFERVFFGDLQREKRGLENASLREDIRRKKIENLASTFDLAKKIPDRATREAFLESVMAAIRPFEEDHPPLKRANVTDRERRLL